MFAQGLVLMSTQKSPVRPVTADHDDPPLYSEMVNSAKEVQDTNIKPMEPAVTAKDSSQNVTLRNWTD